MDIYGYSHIHTRYTDGDLSLLEVKKLMLDYGASFMLITEHREHLNATTFKQLAVECHQLSDDDILIITGLEVAAGNNHILILGAEQFYEENDIVDLLTRYKADGCPIIWAHPHRNKYKIEDNLLSLLDGIEIWNSAYDTKYCPRYSSLQYARYNFKKDWLLLPALDFHRQSHLPGPKIFLSVEKLRTEEVIRQIKLGQYKIGKKEGVSSKDCLTKRYYFYFYLSLLIMMMFKFFKTTDSFLSALHIKVPVKIKNYLRRYI